MHGEKKPGFSKKPGFLGPGALQDYWGGPYRQHQTTSLAKLPV